MNKEREEIAKKIRDGSYFTDAFDWYARKYIHPIHERSIILIFAATTIFAFFIIISTVQDKASFETEMPFPLYSANSTDYITVMKPLAERNESVQEAVAKYLLADYIKTREEYLRGHFSTAEQRNRIRKIRANSTRSVFSEYAAHVDAGNPRSPFVIFRNASRHIDIKSVRFLDNNPDSGRADIIFEAAIDKPGEGRVKKSWKATMVFRLPDILTIARTGAPLRFLVSYYKVEAL